MEVDESSALAMEPGYIPVAPPKSRRKSSWNYDNQLYTQRNQIECFSALLSGFAAFYPLL